MTRDNSDLNCPVLIGLGANLPSQAGPPRATIEAALAALGEGGATLITLSRFYRSPAWPPSDQPEFVNAVASVATELSAEALLALLHTVERRFGRERREVNAARTLDLDLLDFRGEVCAGAAPILPHPRLAERAFVLLPLADAAPQWRHPVSGLMVDELISALPVGHGCRLSQ